MEPFDLVPAPVYNKALNGQLVSKQKVPKYQVEQVATYQIELIEKETVKNFLAKADSLVEKVLSCLRLKLSNWHVFGMEEKLDCFCWFLPNNCIEKMQTFWIFLLLYLTLLADL